MSFPASGRAVCTARLVMILLPGQSFFVLSKWSDLKMNAMTAQARLAALEVIGGAYVVCPVFN